VRGGEGFKRRKLSKEIAIRVDDKAANYKLDSYPAEWGKYVFLS